MLFRLRTKLYTVLQSLASSAWFAYGTLALLQFKVVFGMWFYRDLPQGDTAYYFANAARFYTATKTNIAWSPLYAVFYGTLLNFTDNAYAVTIAHRLVL